MNKPGTMMRRFTLAILVLILSLATSTSVAAQEERIFNEDQLDQPFRSGALSAILSAPFPYDQLKPTFDTRVHTAHIFLDTNGKVIRVNWSPTLPTYPGCEELDSALYKAKYSIPKIFNKPVKAMIKVKIFLSSDSSISKKVTLGVDSVSGLKVPMPDEMTYEEEQAKPLNNRSVMKNMRPPRTFHERRITGRVAFRVLIDPTGTQVARTIVGNYNLELAYYFEEHLKQFLFSPAMDAGKPVWSWVLIPFEFKIL